MDDYGYVFVLKFSVTFNRGQQASEKLAFISNYGSFVFVHFFNFFLLLGGD